MRKLPPGLDGEWYPIVERAVNEDVFPAEEIFALGRRMGLPECVCLQFPDSDNRYPSALEAMKRIASGEDQPISASGDSTGDYSVTKWQACFDAARLWYLNHTNMVMAHAIFEELIERSTVCHVRLNLKHLVIVGLRSGKPSHIMMTRSGTPCSATLPIEISAAIETCVTHAKNVRVEGDLVLLGDDTVIRAGAWLPVFEVIELWWHRYGPVMP